MLSTHVTSFERCILTPFVSVTVSLFRMNTERRQQWSSSIACVLNCMNHLGEEGFLVHWIFALTSSTFPPQNRLSTVTRLYICYRFCLNKTSPRQLYSCQFATGFATTKPSLVSYTAVNSLQVLPQQNKPSSVIQLLICCRFCHNKTSSHQLYSCQFPTGFATTKQALVNYTAVNLLQVLPQQNSCQFATGFAATKPPLDSIQL